MNTHYNKYNINLVLFLTSILMGLNLGCGREESSPYDQGGKVFSLKSENSAVHGEKETNQDRIEEVLTPKPEVIEDDPEDIVEIAEDSIIYHAMFQGGMVYESIRIFTKSLFGYLLEYKPEEVPFPASSYIPMDFLRDLPDVVISLEGQQNYGTERGSQTKQTIDFPIMDLVEASGDANVSSLFPNGDTFSGETTAHGIKIGCPPGLGCVERTDVRPKQEGLVPYSYCYFDSFKQPTFVVSGVSPAASSDTFSEKEVEYGPYVAVKVGIDQACTDADLSKASKPFKTSFMKTANTYGHFSRLQDPFSHAVAVQVFFIDDKEKRIPSETQPYVDSVIGMQSLTVYYMDEATYQFTRVLKRFYIPAMSFPLSIGMKVDGVFSFCQDKRNENNPSLCD